MPKEELAYAAFCTTCKREILRDKDCARVDAAAYTHAIFPWAGNPHVVSLQHLTILPIGAYTATGWTSVR